MKTHQISVTVNKESIQVIPETLVMTDLEEVRWAGTNSRKFALVFDGSGPFAARELSHDQAVGVQRPRSRGRFKYTVVSEEDPGLRLDPVVVVEEPPTGTEP